MQLLLTFHFLQSPKLSFITFPQILQGFYGFAKFTLPVQLSAYQCCTASDIFKFWLQWNSYSAILTHTFVDNKCVKETELYMENI